jgi:glucose-6-phosphate isomerase
MFETIVSINDTGATLPIPEDEANVDGLNFLSGVDLNEVNKTAMKGTILAHVDGGVPNVLVELKDRSEYSMGYLLYFFDLFYNDSVPSFSCSSVPEYK